jgi:hypothetical protein
MVFSLWVCLRRLNRLLAILMSAFVSIAIANAALMVRSVSR